jgi:tetratricopeptide (TPR) repeat protein
MIWATKYLCVLLLLSGCVATKTTTLIVNSTLEESTPILHWRSDSFELVDVPSVTDIFKLSEDRQNHFLHYYYAETNKSVAGHKRLYNYLDNFLDGFDYKGKTYNAHLASTERAGNCLSLAVLTKAYASLVDLDIKFRKVNSAPIYQRNVGVMTISSHIQTHLYAPKKILKDKNSINVLRSKIIIDYFPSSQRYIGGLVKDVDFTSMYYQNLAAEAIVDGEFDLAYSLLSAAMKLSANNSETLNTLAVLHKITGNKSVAEVIYLSGIKGPTSSVSMLSNYILLLEEDNRFAEVASMKAKYNEIRDDNPYRWYDLANQAYAKENYSQALKYYEKSIHIAPYLHESFFGQAKTYFHLGMRRKAKIAMKRAVELAYKPRDEKLYLAKLNSLTQYSRQL